MKTIRPRLTEAEYEVLTKLKNNDAECIVTGYKALSDENNKLHMRNMDLNDYNNKLIDEMEMNAQEISYSADANIKLKETIKAQVSEINHLKTKCTTLESKLHHAVTEGAKTCNKLNDVIQSKNAVIEAGQRVILAELQDNEKLQTKVKNFSVLNAVLWFGVIGSIAGNLYRIFGG